MGGFPEWLPRFGEDTLFAIRLHSAGCKFAIARDAKVDWRPKSSLRSFLRQQRYYAEADGIMGLQLLSLRSFVRRWTIILSTIAIGVLTKSFVLGGAFFCALLITDVIRLKLKIEGYTFRAYSLWFWLVPLTLLLTEILRDSIRYAPKALFVTLRMHFELDYTTADFRAELSSPDVYTTDYVSRWNDRLLPWPRYTLSRAIKDFLRRRGCLDAHIKMSFCNVTARKA